RTLRHAIVRTLSNGGFLIIAEKRDRPRPRRLRDESVLLMRGSSSHFAAALARDHLASKPHIGLASRAAIIVEQRRLAVRWRFGNPDVPRDDRAIDLVAEMRADIALDLVGEVVALVDHR